MADNSKDEDLRRWAIEQVIQHHKCTGVVMSTIIAEAEALIAYIKNGKAE